MKTGTKIITLDNGYHLWTNTQGEGDIHLLALHGGPGGNHEYWEDAADQLKKQGLNVQVTMYDQLGSLYSDQPDYSDPEIAQKYLTYEYFLDEVDEVREKLGGIRREDEMGSCGCSGGTETSSESRQV